MSVTDSFHAAHNARYGYAQPENAVEIVSARLRSAGLVEKPKARSAAKASPTRREARPHDYAKVYFSARRPERTALYNRDELRPGERLKSPCIITEYSATTLVPAGAKASVDPHRNIIIEP